MRAKYIRNGELEDLTKNNVYKVVNNKQGLLEIIDDTGVKCWFVAEKFELIDTIVDSVVYKYKQRSNVGIDKYGVTLDRDDLTTLEWLQHAQEEAMDLSLYLEKIMNKIKDKENE